MINAVLDPFLSAAHSDFLASHPEGADEAVHMLPVIVDRVIGQLSPPGGLVLDPFAGFGTTLIQAVKLGRRALGVELLPERIDHIRRRIPNARVIEGDARELLRLVGGFTAAGSVDLILTSPPYMTVNEHTADPLTAYELEGGNYGRYLAELGLVAAQCAALVAPGGFVVWNVADIDYLGVTTPLIADCARVLAEHLRPAGVTEIGWDRYPHDLVADALLVFQRPVATHFAPSPA